MGRALHRRQFLGKAAQAAWGSALVGLGQRPGAAWSQTASPASDQPISIGAIGVGGRGALLLEQLPDDARIVALCDCNLPRAEAWKAKVGGDWPVYQDYRRILDRSDIDAVIVATGEFQRVLPCIHACQAGKDIYAEKPLTLYIREGRELVEAVRHHQRVLQVGTQQRSMAMNRIACQFLRQGGLGKIRTVRGINYPGAEDASAQQGVPQPVPEGLDWNSWLNQAAWREFHPDWLGWMRWKDFAGGEMTNWGAHGVDQIQWALGADETGPVKTWPIASGPPGAVGMHYANGVEVRFDLEMGHGPMGGAVFICEGGKLEINRNKFTSNPPEIAEKLLQQVDAAEEERKWSDQLALWQARWHLQDWLDCIRTRQKPVADVEIGHRSISVCHLANITRGVNRPLSWDPDQERFVDDDQANQWLERPRRAGFELPTTG